MMADDNVELTTHKDRADAYKTGLDTLRLCCMMILDRDMNKKNNPLSPYALLTIRYIELLLSCFGEETIGKEREEEEEKQ